jgi:Glycosyl transferase family 2
MKGAATRQAYGIVSRHGYDSQRMVELPLDVATGHEHRGTGDLDPEVSFVIPCLNEEEGVGIVVRDVRERLAALGVAAEVIVVDNGSTDASRQRASDAGADVIDEPRRGYGSAYLTGVAAARGRYVFMVDADDTYDLERLGELLERLRSGADLVLGSRFEGGIDHGAMHWLNRHVGNPVLTGMLNLLFGAGVSDAHCGLRAARREVLAELKLSATGMEFASEMVIKASKQGRRIDEVPVRYRPRVGESKLNRVPDAWRHVRFMLVHSPAFLFAVPGGLALGGSLGALIVLAALPGLGDPWTGVSVTAAMLALVGFGIIQLGVFARTYSAIYLGEPAPLLERGWQRFRLEDGLAASGLVVLVGLTVTGVSFFDGTKDPRLGILGVTLVALGLQAMFASFFLSILGLSEHAILRRGGRR